MINSPTIAVVAECVERSNVLNLETEDLEFMDPATCSRILTALQSLRYNVLWYDSPNDLDKLDEIVDPLVFPLWSGVRSRNRRALIPAICEARGLKYIGADVYTSILCQDKYLSKVFAGKFNIKSPKGVLLTSRLDLPLLEHLLPPLVVKPNLQGGSIGISAASLVHSRHDAKKLACTLLDTFNQPVLVEEFIDGDEVSIIITGNREKVDFLDMIELSVPSVNLADSVLGMEIKKNPSVMIQHQLASSRFSKALASRAERLFSALGKVDYMRIDGRIKDSEFNLIELTPDVSLKPSSTFAVAFELHGIAYEEMLANLIAAALRFYKA